MLTNMIKYIYRIRKGGEIYVDPLHVHSEYSTLDGAVKIKEYVKWAADHGLPAAAVTDHGFLSCIPEFAKEAKKAGIKPIFGMEPTLTP